VSVKRYQNWRDVRQFWCAGEGTSSSIKNELEMTKLRIRKIKKKRVALVKSRMNKRGSSSNSNVVIVTGPNLFSVRAGRFTKGKVIIRQASENQR
jgi:hypothetical protein